MQCNIMQHRSLKIFLQCLVWKIYSMRKTYIPNSIERCLADTCRAYSFSWGFTSGRLLPLYHHVDTPLCAASPLIFWPLNSLWRAVNSFALLYLHSCPPRVSTLIYNTGLELLLPLHPFMSICLTAGWSVIISWKDGKLHFPASIISKP